MTSDATAGNPAGGAGDPANPAGGGAPQPWYTGAAFSDEDRATLEAKGWNASDPIEANAKILKSYKDMEKVFRNRENAVLLPRMDDAKARSEFFTKHMGKPATADKYVLPESMTKGGKANEALLAKFQALAHSSDMMPHQFEAFVAGWEKMAQEAEQAAADKFNGDTALSAQKLQDELGDQYGEHVARGNLALNKLGLSAQDRDALGQALGVERGTRVLMKIGEMLASHKAHGLEPNPNQDGFVTEKARAQQRVSAIKMLAKDATGPDADFRRALLNPGHPEHKRVNAEWTRLQAIANSK
jgi:hypothetical protein